MEFWCSLCESEDYLRTENDPANQPKNFIEKILKHIIPTIQKTLTKQLDERADKPALIFGHYNPYPNRGARPIKGMRDGSSLLKLLDERKHARA